MNLLIISKSIRKLITLKSILFLTSIVYLIPKFIYVNPGVGIDSSFGLAINMAIKEGLIFGKDIVYTFGPLGYLSTARPNYVSELCILLFYLFICLNTTYVIYYFFKSTKTKFESIFVFLLLFFTGNFLFLRDSITLYFFLIFHIFYYLKYKNNLSILIISISCLLSFYIKVNSGLVMNVVFLSFIIYNYLFHTINYTKNTLLFIGHFFVLWFLSFFLNTDFIPYIVNSLPIIDSYNDAMVISLWNKMTLFIPLAIFLMIIFVFLRSLKSILRSHYDIFLFSNIFLFSFVLFKQSFVRADWWHQTFFFFGIPYVIILIYLFTGTNKLKIGIYYSIIIASILSISRIKEPIGDIINRNIGRIVFINNSKNIIPEENYSRILPNKIMNKIENKTVDLLGQEVTYVFYNKLKYNPRPIFQSYSAYDPKLIDLNCLKYDSKTSPDYILYHFGSIDGRHPFWDEPKIYLSLFRNYSITDRIPSDNDIGDLVLFKKNKLKRTISKSIIKDTVVNLNSKIKIPKSENLLYLTMESEYTLAGKIKRTLFQPYLVYMDIDYEDNDSSHNRLVLPIMKSGVPINKKVLSFNDAYKFFNSNGEDNINATSFILKSKERWIENSFRIKFIEYKIN